MTRLLPLCLMLLLSACQTPWYRLKLQNQNLRDELAASEADNDGLRKRLESLGHKVSMTESQLQKLRDQERAHEAELSRLQDSLKGSGIEARIENGQAVLTLPNKLFFKSGDHKLSGKGADSLNIVVGILNDKYKEFTVSVEGHTDSDPIVKSKDRYKDNYMLSSERARSVLKHLENKGVSNKRLRGVFYGPNRPVAPNRGASKAKNRRVEIVLIR